jgi:hypothetical protein
MLGASVMSRRQMRLLPLSTGLWVTGAFAGPLPSPVIIAHADNSHNCSGTATYAPFLTGNSGQIGGATVNGNGNVSCTSNLTNVNVTVRIQQTHFGIQHEYVGQATASTGTGPTPTATAPCDHGTNTYRTDILLQALFSDGTQVDEEHTSNDSTFSCK